MKSSNILFINHYAGSPIHGMEYRHYFLAKQLKEIGNNVTIVASTASHLHSKSPETNSIFKDEIIDGINYIWVKSPKYNKNGIMRFVNMFFFSFFVIFLKYKKKPDVVIGTSPHPFALLNAIWIANKNKVPSIIEIRDLWPLMLIELGSISKFHPISILFKWIEEYTFKKADLTISLWSSADKYMFKNGLDRDKYLYLPNGIQINDIAPNHNHDLINFVDKLKKEGKFIFGYAGSHGHANPLSQIIDACNILQNNDQENRKLVFLMVGDGPDKDSIVQQAKDLNLENILFFDSVDREVILAFLQKIDVAFIGLKDLPLFKYGPTPNKLMDYMASSKPIIYAINSSFDPVKTNNLGLSIPPDDGSSLAESMVHMSKLDPKELEKIGKRSREFVEENYSYKNLAETLNQEIIKVINAKKNK